MRRWASASRRACLDGVEDPLVLALDALEEVHRLQQLGEAVGLQHDGDEVRLAAGVAQAQERGELGAGLLHPRAQPQRALALAVAALHGRGQLRLGGGELGLHRGDAAFEDRHLARGGALEARQPRDAAGQRLLAGALRVDPVAQPALALLAAGGHGDERRGHEGDDGDEEEGKATTAAVHAAAVLNLASARAPTQRCTASCACGNGEWMGQRSHQPPGARVHHGSSQTTAGG